MVGMIFVLLSAVIPVENWLIITANERPVNSEISSLVNVLRRAEARVYDFSGLKPVASPVVVKIAATSGDFRALTGCSIWQGAAVINGELTLQPFRVLEKRGITEQVITHEYLHLVLSPYKLPLWMNEGLAVVCSGEVQGLSANVDIDDLTEDIVKIKKLLASSDTLQLKRGYLSAASLVEKTIEKLGRDSLFKLIIQEAL